jgi:hypothetical protein
MRLEGATRPNWYRTTDSFELIQLYYALRESAILTQVVRPVAAKPSCGRVLGRGVTDRDSFLKFAWLVGRGRALEFVSRLHVVGCEPYVTSDFRP